MPKRFDTEGTPFLFVPHSERELDEYFSGNHENSVSAVARDVIASLSEAVTGFRARCGMTSATIGADTSSR